MFNSKKNINNENNLNLSDEEVLLRKYDKGSNHRILSGIQHKLVYSLMIAFTLFQLYTAIFGAYDAMIQRSIHLGFGLLLIYLLYPSRKSFSKTNLHAVDIVLAVIGAACCFYIVANYQSLVLRAGRVTTLDMVVGVLAILLVLEAARRAVGLPMVVIACVFISYALLGPYIPGALGHRGVQIDDLVQHLFYTTEGILGIPIGVSASFIFMFMLFGAYLEQTGVSKFFMDFCNSIAGASPGGPAKVAVISSGLMGTVSGSSVANVVGTGNFTIPMMVKLGYKREFAGAVEATASTGGQLMPPIMGAAAFLMAEMTGIPYITIVYGAIIPALLYYIGIWCGVHFEALRDGLKGLPKDEVPNTIKIIKKSGYLIIPIVIIFVLLVNGYTPIRAALAAIVSSILLAGLKKESRLSFKNIVDGMANGAKSALTIVAATACAGIIIGVITQTGMGLKLGGTLVSWANGNLFFTLVLAMLTSMVLGMGVPTTANYIITATIVAPALLLLGVPLLAAHLFVFYFGIIADVTPPVAMAAVAASGISKSDPLKTGLVASRLAIVAFVIPYVFVYNPQMLLLNATPLQVVYLVATAIFGTFFIASGLTGWYRGKLNLIEKFMYIGGGLMLLTTPLYVNILGALLILVVHFIQIKKHPEIRVFAKA